jgi:hypothetical protein
MQNNLEKYIGKTFIGFKFEHLKHDCIGYRQEMDEYIGKELTITSFDERINWFRASNNWYYPADLVIAQIEANEKPTFEVGELIHVWDSDSGKECHNQTLFLYEKDGLIAGVFSLQFDEFRNNKPYQVAFWKHAQKIPAKTKMSKQEFKEKFGVEFDNLIVE